MEQEKRVLRVLLRNYTKIEYKGGVAKVIFDEHFEDIAEEIVKLFAISDVRHSVCTFWDLCDSKKGDLCIDNDEDCKYHKWA